MKRIWEKIENYYHSFFFDIMEAKGFILSHSNDG